MYILPNRGNSGTQMTTIHVLRRRNLSEQTSIAKKKLPASKNAQVVGSGEEADVETSLGIDAKDRQCEGCSHELLVHFTGV